jgi:hypothetical protein
MDFLIDLWIEERGDDVEVIVLPFVLGRKT